MKLKTVLITFLAGFVCLCGFLVMDSGLFDNERSADSSLFISLATNASMGSAPETGPVEVPEDATFSKFTAINVERSGATIGSLDKESGFKFQLELTSLGAGISMASLSEYDDRNPDDPQPLVVLAPVVKSSSKEIYSLANNVFKVGDQSLDLSRLDWNAGEIVIGGDGSQSVTFDTAIKKKFLPADKNLNPIYDDAIKLTKTYTVTPGSYDVKVSFDVENLTDESVKSAYSLQGPAGIGREGTRQDMRSIVSGYLAGDLVESSKLTNAKLRKAVKSADKEALDMKYDDPTAKFIWACVTNKYFAAIFRPVPKEGESFVADARPGKAQYYDPGLGEKKPDGDEDISFSVSIIGQELSAAGSDGAAASYEFEVFLGPKSEDLFKKNDKYKELGYIQTFSFMPCFVCPESIINPLSFGIMALMKWMYVVVHNYGVVIILLVLLIRVVLHPVTKKSQISMMRMQKMSSHPQLVEIKKKYASNRQEMQKHIMQFYRDQNVSPAAGLTSMLPMLLQMPIWIALYRAIYANIELRGAGFLPFWITDLSSPDALIPFADPLVVPYLGWQIESFNLLPILLGVAMFLQQKLMPHQAAQQADSQAAQQQKMMMFMMPIMMLIFLYSAPSGLNLYIMASTFGGVMEQTIIRKHIREKEAEEAIGLVSVTKKTGGKLKKKKPKPFYKN